MMLFFILLLNLVAGSPPQTYTRLLEPCSSNRPVLGFPSGFP